MSDGPKIEAGIRVPAAKPRMQRGSRSGESTLPDPPETAVADTMTREAQFASEGDSEGVVWSESTISEGPLETAGAITSDSEGSNSPSRGARAAGTAAEADTAVAVEKNKGKEPQSQNKAQSQA